MSIAQSLPLAERVRLLDSLYSGTLFEPLVKCDGCGEELSRRAALGHGQGLYWCRPCAEALDDQHNSEGQRAA